MKFAFYTLGCKVNQYETQAMQQILLSRGHVIVSAEEPCDGFIINTCTVTAVSDKKSRNMIRRVRKMNPEAAIGVCGCYAQTAPEDIRKLGADVIVGTSDRLAFVDHVEQAAASGARWEHVEDANAPRPFEVLPSGGLAERTRALLKVEDGCNNFCSYCIIPYARGRVRSLPLETAVEEARKLAEQGYREIVINGIEISSWGQERRDGSSLPDLLAAVCAEVPDVRIRLGSLEPRTIDETFCERLSRFGNLCPQFHLSLQSGSDTVLRRMNRKYDTARYLHSVQLLQRYFPGCAVTTDLIVGFPGETEEEFVQSLAFLETCRLAQVHIFPYSRRKGTPAAKMDGQLTAAEKEERAARAAKTAEGLEKTYRENMIGSTKKVLFEQPEKGRFAGHAENYVKVYAEGSSLHNRVCSVRITGLAEDGVVGEIVPDSVKTDEK